jgi:hypothetical protein
MVKSQKRKNSQWTDTTESAKLINRVFEILQFCESLPFLKDP